MSSLSQFDSDRRRPLLVGEMLELIAYRDLLRLLVSNINRSRYKRSMLGVVWTLLNPLINMIVLSVVFSHLFRFPLVHYPVYVLSGLVFWNFFSQTTIYAMNTLVWGGGLLKRVYLPRSIFAAASIGNGLVNLGISVLLLLSISLVMQHPVTVTWLFVPVAVLVLAIFSFGVALLLSAFAVFFTDVVEMYTAILQAWFFATPVIYPMTILPKELALYMKLNPIFGLLEMFRAPIYRGEIPDAMTIILSVGLALLTFLVGWWQFTRKADEFAYRV